MENEYVKKVVSILSENGRDITGLTALLDYVTNMESHLSKALNELQTVQHELSDLREEHDHPIRTLLQSVEANINNGLKQLNELKEKIVDGCRNAVEMFKQKGISALNNMTNFFKVKPILESMRGNMQNLINNDLKSIAKIETISSEYNAATMHLKNIARAYVGKETIKDVNPSGKLTQLAVTPYRIEIKFASKALKNIEKAVAGLDKLDRATLPQRPPMRTSKASTKTKKSVIETIKSIKEQIALGAAMNEPVKGKEKKTEPEL
jgi:ABC-type transporter Mla subunit MlaD